MRHDLAGQMRQNRGLVARAGADLEHVMVGSICERLGHRGDHIGLADGLAAGDRQRLIGIGDVGLAVLDEVLARHLVQRAQHADR